jgi:hypothetical protein
MYSYLDDSLMIVEESLSTVVQVSEAAVEIRQQSFHLEPSTEWTVVGLYTEH